MKTLTILILTTLALHAGPPQKKAYHNYAPLWTDSPFTTKPLPPSGPTQPLVNPLADWALGGISKFPEGYFIILINKKKPDERKVIEPGVVSDFKILEVKNDGDKYTDTTVKLAYGSMQGEVTYDTKLITLKTAAPAQNPNGQQQQQQGIPGQIPMPNISSGNPNHPGMINRPPGRLRTITPPSDNGGRR